LERWRWGHDRSHAFAPLLFDVTFVPYPIADADEAIATAAEQTILATTEKELVEAGDRYAGIIIDPLVQGAYGMRMGRSQFLQQLQQLA